MPSRASKEERLKDNIDKAVERWRRSIERKGGRVTPEERRKMRLEFIESAKRIDRTKLHEVWN